MFGQVSELLEKDPVESLTRRGLVDRFEALRGLRGAVDAYEARLVTATNRLGDSGIDGASMLRTTSRVSDRAAASAQRRAECLEELPAAREALAAGRITSEHVDSLAAAAKQVSSERVDRELIDRAARCPADVFDKETRRWTTANCADDGTDQATRQRRVRRASKWVKAATNMRGFYCELDALDGDRVHKSLQQRYDQLWRDDGGRDGTPDEIRSPEQRLADAFVELVAGSSGQNETGKATHPKHQISAVFDVAGKTDQQGRPLAELVTDGQRLPAPVLERLACDAVITPMIFDGPGRPIWVGRDHRSATTAQWKSLITRDRGCIGCKADPARCEAHHVVAWLSLGPTDITNLVLVCSRCHHDIHDREMVLERIDGHWQILSRAGPTNHHLTLAS